MSKEISVYINDILESIEKIEEFIRDVTEKDFCVNIEKQYAVIRALEIIGEATSDENISEEFKTKNPDIPWKKIKAMRNILIHAYGKVDIEEVWRVIEKDLPNLKKQISDLKEKNKEDK